MERNRLTGINISHGTKYGRTGNRLLPHPPWQRTATSPAFGFDPKRQVEWRSSFVVHTIPFQTQYCSSIARANYCRPEDKPQSRLQQPVISGLSHTPKHAPTPNFLQSSEFFCWDPLLRPGHPRLNFPNFVPL